MGWWSWGFWWIHQFLKNDEILACLAFRHHEKLERFWEKIGFIHLDMHWKWEDTSKCPYCWTICMPASSSEVREDYSWFPLQPISKFFFASSPFNFQSCISIKSSAKSDEARCYAQIALVSFYAWKNHEVNCYCCYCCSCCYYSFIEFHFSKPQRMDSWFDQAKRSSIFGVHAVHLQSVPLGDL